MIEEDVGNRLGRGLRHRRIPDEGPATATSRCRPALRLRPTRPTTIRGPQVIDFLGHLLRHLPGKLLVMWDGLSAHRSHLVRDFILARRERLAVERLPSYAPELNPVEYLWGYWKHHELPNYCPRDFAQLSHQACRALRRMRRRPPLLRSFWHQAELSL